MYAKGMTTKDIFDHILDSYRLEVSDSTISRVTDKILPVVKDWQQTGRRRDWGRIHSQPEVFFADRLPE